MTCAATPLLTFLRASAQSTFCINSIAHYLGETPFDDRKTAKDHFFSGECVGLPSFSPAC